MVWYGIVWYDTALQKDLSFFTTHWSGEGELVGEVDLEYRWTKLPKIEENLHFEDFSQMFDLCWTHKISSLVDLKLALTFPCTRRMWSMVTHLEDRDLTSTRGSATSLKCQYIIRKQIFC